MEAPRNMEKSIGQVEICIHQAKNIRNICIYQNQDVYARIFLNDKPEKQISTNVVNEGGQNPVFNETIKLDIETTDSSLRCEVWMLSRIKNYLEDQLLGFLLLPLSDVVSESGKPAREFELSSSEVFHSPAGFVELSFDCNGTVMEMSRSQPSVGADAVPHNTDICYELDKIEFSDQAMANEHQRMASEYLSCPCDDVDDDVTETRVAPSKDSASSPVETETADCVEIEEKVVQEEIVDMYMKSMQQFTDALAKMKLPIDAADAEKGSSKVEESGSDGKANASRVFYGSRAFF
ncbi:Calcium-dependent lipid-binding family protein [Perilla frutescens var. hirtella]|uniref:Calcium-dependent lipid-binding family protein n=1 Tax=Perilla frutescens var. hirtella TaxID=608512 RepID=A0AAD4P058_PERFH|nr:Calcium-dependent lipid-binding family protein [Perilla frutescens var. hirtella]